MAETDSRSVFPPDTREPRMTQTKILWNVRNFLFIFFFAAYRCGCFACVEMQQKKHSRWATLEWREKKWVSVADVLWMAKAKAFQHANHRSVYAQWIMSTHLLLPCGTSTTRGEKFLPTTSCLLLFVNHHDVIHSLLDWLPLCGDERWKRFTDATFLRFIVLNRCGKN